MRICIENNCEQPICARSLCTKHYQQKKTQNKLPPTLPKICTVSNCNEKVEALGYCKSHYRAFKKHGDPLVIGISNTQFTSERIKAFWADSEFRKRRITSFTGANNPLFKNAKKKANCIIDGVEFEYYESNGSSGLYCSRECSFKSQIRADKLRAANLGKKATLATRKKLSKAHVGLQVGEKSGSWKGGITNANINARGVREYGELRLAVFKRDNYICQHCGHRSNKLHLNHKKGWSEYPGLRFNIDNCETLCIPCHYLITFGYKMPINSKWGLGNPGYYKKKIIGLT